MSQTGPCFEKQEGPGITATTETATHPLAEALHQRLDSHDGRGLARSPKPEEDDPSFAALVPILDVPDPLPARVNGSSPAYVSALICTCDECSHQKVV